MIATQTGVEPMMLYCKLNALLLTTQIYYMLICFNQIIWMFCLQVILVLVDVVVITAGRCM